MKITVSFHGVEHVSRTRLRELFEARAHHLELHRLSTLQPDLIRLEGRIEKNPSRHLYRMALRLKLPSAVLTTRAEHHELPSVFSETFHELERRTDKHLARLQRSHLWKSTARRRQLERLRHEEWSRTLQDVP